MCVCVCVCVFHESECMQSVYDCVCDLVYTLLSISGGSESAAKEVERDPGSSSQQPGRRVPSPSVMETRKRGSKGINPSHHQHQQQTQQLNDDEDEYAIINLTLLEKFINNIVNQHSSKTPTGSEPTHCKEAQISLSNHRSLISLSTIASCKNCSFKTSKVNLYHTMPNTFKNIISQTDEETSSRGCRASTLNASLAGAILNSSIGATQMREILLSIGVDCGSRTALNKLINQVGQVKVNLGRESMSRGVEKLKSQETKSPGSTFISMDGMYNNKTRRGPFQAGTQMLFTTIGSTGEEKIAVSMGSLNKLCHVGAELENRGLGSCQEGHAMCTQTIAETAAISQEGMMTHAALEDLKNQGYVPKQMTVDGDTSIRKEVKKFCEGNQVQIDVDFDVGHHIKNTQKLVQSKYPFDQKSFPGKNSKIKQRAVNQLSMDIKNRCHSELKRASNKTEGMTAEERPAKVASLCAAASDAILDCLQGHCEACENPDQTRPENASLVCHGNSSKMQIGKQYPLTEHNKSIALARINTFFELKRVKQIYKFHDSNANEALHRGFLRTGPKTSTWSRNFEANACSEILNYNEGIARHVDLLNRAIGHKVCFRVKEKLEKISLDKISNTNYSRKKETKEKRHLKVVRQYAKHRELHGDGETSGIGAYRKGVDIESSSSAESGSENEHE